MYKYVYFINYYLHYWMHSAYYEKDFKTFSLILPIIIKSVIFHIPLRKDMK